jgi:hypothetical protein
MTKSISESSAMAPKTPEENASKRGERQASAYTFLVLLTNTRSYIEKYYA